MNFIAFFAVVGIAQAGTFVGTFSGFLFRVDVVLALFLVLILAIGAVLVAVTHLGQVDAVVVILALGGRRAGVLGLWVAALLVLVAAIATFAGLV